MKKRNTRTSRCAISFSAVPVLTALLCCWLTGSGLAGDLSGRCLVRVPAWLHLEEVGREMRINGLPASVCFLQTRHDQEDVLNLFQQQWQDRGKGARQVTVRGYHFLTHLEDGLLYTLQLPPAAGNICRGYLSVSAPHRFRKSLGRQDVPVLRETKIISRIDNREGGVKNLTILMTNPWSLQANLQFYRQYYLDGGWNSQMDRQENDSNVLVFTQHGRETCLVLTPESGKTRIVLSQIDKR